MDAISPVLQAQEILKTIKVSAGAETIPARGA